LLDASAILATTRTDAKLPAALCPLLAFAVDLPGALGRRRRLGLSIARKAITAHGGDVYVRNLPGKGCIFVIEVPLVAEGVAALPVKIAR